jgi:hypothetical protein
MNRRQRVEHIAQLLHDASRRHQVAPNYEVPTEFDLEWRALSEPARAYVRLVVSDVLDEIALTEPHAELAARVVRRGAARPLPSKDGRARSNKTWMKRKITAKVDLKVRMRERLRRKIESAAKAKNVSMNAEMVTRLEDSFKQAAFLDDMCAALREELDAREQRRVEIKDGEFVEYDDDGSVKRVRRI